MFIPRRLKQQAGRFALVDGISFHLPVNCEQSPALMAAFRINYDQARALMPGNEVHPFRFGRTALLVISVIDYRITDIGKYIEFSIAIACTHGARPAPPYLPGLLMKTFGTGQYVVDLPVSTEVSVKGGKGIWGMPKHQANLNYIIGERTVSSQYDLDGRLCMKIEIDLPRHTRLPFRASAANYCQFRGMLMKSYIHFRGRIGVRLFSKASARLLIGDHPRMQPLKRLEIEPHPVFTAFVPSATGTLDDYFECWFVSYPSLPSSLPEGLESVVHLGQGRQWLPAPSAPTPGVVAPVVEQR